MEIKFKARAFGGFDKTEVLKFISTLVRDYDEKLRVYVEKIAELKLENSELKSKLSSEQAKAKIAELEAERKTLSEREQELSAQLDTTRAKLAVLADRIIELERDRLIISGDEREVEETAQILEVSVTEETEEVARVEENVKIPKESAQKKVQETTEKIISAPELQPQNIETRDDIISALEKIDLTEA